MNILIFSFGLGIASVLQGGLNKNVSLNYGFLKAALLNNFVLLLTTIVIMLLAGEKFAFRSGNGTPFSLSYLIPGVLGIMLVAGIPYAISKVGTLEVFIPLIVSQVICSLIWDCVLEGKTIALTKVFGSIVALGGTLVVFAAK